MAGAEPGFAVFLRTPRIDQVPAFTGEALAVECGVEFLFHAVPELARGLAFQLASLEAVVMPAIGVFRRERAMARLLVRFFQNCHPELVWDYSLRQGLIRRSHGKGQKASRRGAHFGRRDFYWPRICLLTS